MTGASAVYDPSAFRRVFVDDVEKLRIVVDELHEADSVGVDLEMVQRVERRPGGYQEWIQVLALIQIASEEVSAVIDPVRCRDLSALRPFMRGPTRKVFLGGGQDDSLLRQAGIPARNIVDVGEIALALFGRRQDGMAALAGRIFGISLDKTVRRTDWLARPLNPVLLAYAHRDAELTLLIYRWLQDHYPDVVLLHERPELDPQLPSSAPDWLREVAYRSSSDPLAIVMDEGLDLEKDAERMAEDIRSALRESRAPRQTNRLLRVAGDLGLRALLPDVVPYAESQSSMLRAASARAIGQLAELDTGEPILQRLRQDPIEDVKKAADSALRELRAPRVLAQEPVSELETSSLDDGTRSALEQLLQQMEGQGTQ